MTEQRQKLLRSRTWKRVDPDYHVFVSVPSVSNPWLVQKKKAKPRHATGVPARDGHVQTRPRGPSIHRQGSQPHPILALHGQRAACYKQSTFPANLHAAVYPEQMAKSRPVDKSQTVNITRHPNEFVGPRSRISKHC